MKKAQYKFQTMDIDYPEILFAFGFWTVDKKDGQKWIYFLHNIFNTFEELEKESALKIEELNSMKDRKTLILPIILVLPLRFNRLIPLTKKLWTESPLLHENVIERISNFAKAGSEYYKYEMLVTPEIMATNEILFTSAEVFERNTKYEEIEKFMLNSNLHVASEAKNAAVYTLEPTFGYDLETGEIVGEKVAN